MKFTINFIYQNYMNENNSYAVFDVTVFDMEVGKWCWCLFQTEHVSFVANE